MARPGDFFVGVTDLFSVLLPGAVVTFVGMKAEQSLNPPSDLFGLLQLRDVPGYMAFVVCAFLSGHLVDMIGASVLDRIYDLLYADFKRSGVGLRSWLKATPQRLVEVARQWRRFHLRHPSVSRPKEDPTNLQDPVYRAASALAEPKPDKDKLYQWCRDWLQLRSPQSLQEPDRLQANSKFFRGLVVVAAIFEGLFWVLPQFRENFSYSAAQDWLWSVSCLLLIAFAFLRYSDLRWKAVQHVYRLYVISRCCEAPAGGDTIRKPRNEWLPGAESTSEAGSCLSGCFSMPQLVV
jgi:hypothetical protein